MPPLYSGGNLLSLFDPDYGYVVLTGTASGNDYLLLLQVNQVHST